MDDYIASLEYSGEKLTEEAWREWLIHEQKDLGFRLTTMEENKIIDRLYDDGYII